MTVLTEIQVENLYSLMEGIVDIKMWGEKDKKQKCELKKNNGLVKVTMHRS